MLRHQTRHHGYVEKSEDVELVLHQKEHHPL
jgi:hypothetical protein